MPGQQLIMHEITNMVAEMKFSYRKKIYHSMKSYP